MTHGRPVSYTHLDVYKRQVQGIACGMRVKNCYQDMVEQAKANVDDMVAEAAYITQSEAAADEAAE